MAENIPGWTAGTAASALAARLGEHEAARLAATALVEAEIYGQPRFGFDLLSEVKEPFFQPAPRDLPAISSIDAAGAFAPLVLADTTLALVPAVHKLGLVAVFLRGIRGFGRMAPYLRTIADAGYICLAASQAPPFVAPEGGNAPVIGTNPIGFAAGTGDSRLVFDLATSSITMAAVKSARAETGGTLPAGTAIDKNGQPTTSPHDLAAALPRGRLGALTGLMIEVLAGVASGARGSSGGRGVVFIAVDPARVGSTDWQNGLAELRGDWTGANGYWPQANSVAPDLALPAPVTERLAHWLDRLDKQINSGD